MDELIPHAAKAAAILKRRAENIAIAESSTGGLVSAALLAIPGASAYFLGGAVVYTRHARRALLDLPDATLGAMRPASEPYALLLANRVRRQFASTWGLAETGATGPTGNRYGDAAGHACIAVAGPIERVITLETGDDDRAANMLVFAITALDLLAQCLEA